MNPEDQFSRITAHKFNGHQSVWTLPHPVYYLLIFFFQFQLNRMKIFNELQNKCLVLMILNSKIMLNLNEHKNNLMTLGARHFSVCSYNITTRGSMVL